MLELLDLAAEKNFRRDLRVKTKSVVQQDSAVSQILFGLGRGQGGRR